MMEKEKMYALLCYAAALGSYVIATITFFNGGDGGITWLCSGSAMLCFGSLWVNKMNHKDEDK